MIKLIVALFVAVFSLFSYFFGERVYNEITGEEQRVDLTVEQEIALGAQAAPQMARQHGGLDPDERAQALVDAIGARIVARTAAGETDYRFEFHVLDDPDTVNAFALPGGQIFITEGLLRRLDTEGQVAAVLAHEVGHVVARHAAEQLAKAQLTEGLAGAAVIATYDPSDPGSQGAAVLARAVGQLVNMKYGRDDELEADRLGVRFLAEAGYDPRALIGVMRVLAEAGGGRPEFFSTHPSPDNRVAEIEAAIEEQFPDGVPPDLAE
jgi:beta-barrel assembly-enhancing protease